MLIAGEASGDMHGANLVAAMRREAPQARFFGVGGPALRARGMEIMYDSGDLAVVGLVEVFSHLGVILRAMRALTKHLRRRRPDLLVLIDFPDFNLIMAKKAKRLGIPVFYYVSPQVWAWRGGRVKTIGRLVDSLAVILPFEETFYHERGVPQARFVGHPLMDTVRPAKTREACRADHGIGEKDILVGLLPGSRHREVSTLLPVFLEAARRLRHRHPGLRCMLPLAPTLNEADLDLPAWAADELGVVVVRGGRYDIMRACDAVMAASGTVTLELAILGVPMVMAYKVSPMTYFFGRRLISIEHASLVNLVAGRTVVPELLQDEANPDNLVREIERILPGTPGASAMRRRLAETRRRLGGAGASERAARLALACMGWQGGTFSGRGR